MPSSRIFVSYACIGDEQGSKVGRQLVRDIRATGTEAVADHETISDEQFLRFLNQELPQCSYAVFVQTPASLRSLRVQAAVNMALMLIGQQRLRGALRVIAVSSPGLDNQPLLSTLRTFDASMDYPRARDQLFIELGLISLSAEDSFLVPQSALPVSGLSTPPTNNLPPQPSGPISGSFPPVGASLPPRPSGPISGPFPPVGASLPPQPFNAIPGPVASGNLSGGYIPPVQGYTQAALPPTEGRPADSKLSPGKAWFNAQARKERPLKTTQTSVTAQPDKLSVGGAQAMLEDRPLPLNTTRRAIIRWAVAIGLFLLLALAVFLVVFLLQHHTATINHLSPVKHLSPTPTSRPHH